MKPSSLALVVVMPVSYTHLFLPPKHRYIFAFVMVSKVDGDHFPEKGLTHLTFIKD